MVKILVIDDDIHFCETMQSLIRRMGHDCETVHTLKGGIEKLSGDVDVVFLDVRLPDGNGLEALPRIKQAESSPEVIILTGEGDPDGAELAIQGGVWDYLVKPSSIKQTRLSLDRALKYREEKKSEKAPVVLNLDRIIGKSAKMKICFDQVAQAARSNAHVLIMGETGTGKEMFARTIHENSGRAAGNFVVVDCASLTETLLESTLFGHKKGAFTGADSDRTGLVKLADGGTLFLDEVGEMPLSIQKSFLRVLQEKRFRPVGETRELTSNFRLIAATNRDLESMVEKGNFRKDLLFRLWTIRLMLPPLKERLDDIKPLAMHYINILCEEYRVPNKGFESDFFNVMKRYDWPGNVRELFNVLETAFVASGDSRTLYALHLPPDIRIKVAKASLKDGLERRKPEPAFSGPPLRASESVDGETGKTSETGRPGAKEAPAGGEIPSSGFAERMESEYLFDRNCLPNLKDFKSMVEKRYLEELIRRTGGKPKEMMTISGLSKSHFYALLKKNEMTLK